MPRPPRIVRPQIEYTALTDAVEAVVNKWEGDERLLEPGWTPREWAVAVYAEGTRQGWDCLDRRDQDKVLEFLRGKVSCDIYSPKFPSPSMLFCWLVHVPKNGRRGKQWLRDRVDEEALAWFKVIETNLENRPLSAEDHRKALRAEIASLKVASLPDEYKIEIERLFARVEENWDRLERGDDARRSWLAASKVVGITARFLFQWPPSKVKSGMIKMIFPSIDDLISLCGIAKGRSRQLNFNAFRPESRSNEKGSASTQSSYDVSDIRSIPDVLLTSAFETGDEVRIAIGRLCLAYTLDDKYRFTNEKNEDPGWLAFYALKWMISCVQAEQTTREVRHQISWLLHWLLRHAAQGLLASPFELPVNEVALNDNYVRSHEKANGSAVSSASS